MAIDLDTIAALLAKAESSEFEEERESFFAKAQLLATRAEIDLEVLRSRTKSKQEVGTKPIQRTIEVGTKGDRGAGAYTDLYLVIADVNGVYCLSNNKEIDAYGMESDIDITDALFGVIVQQMVRDCVDYIKDDEWRAHTTRSDAKLSFYEGYRKRIGTRLREAKREAERVAHDDYAEQGIDTSLVLADKDTEVQKFYWKDRRKAGYRQRSNGSSSVARRAGDHAGSKARLKGDRGIAGQKEIG